MSIEAMADKTILHLVHALSGEVIEYGEQEAQLVLDKSLPKNTVQLIIKTNTFLTAYASLLIQIVQDSDVPFAKKVLDVWMSDNIQGLAQMAFEDNIAEAQQAIDKAIQDLENIANNEGE
jgi:hypothetical protein